MTIRRAFIASLAWLPATAEAWLGKPFHTTKRWKIPPGFTPCPTCGEFNGKTLSSNWAGKRKDEKEKLVSVSCRCKGFLCRGCGKNTIHRPISNSYEPESNTVGHWPWFTGMMQCRECREAKGERR